MSARPGQSRRSHQRQSFLNQLPQQVAELQNSLLILADNGWDINVQYLLAMRLDELARLAAEHSQTNASNRLHQLQRLVSDQVETGEPPDEEYDGQIRRLVAGLNDYSSDSAAQTPLGQTQRMRHLTAVALAAPELDVSGLPSLSNISHFVTPPDRFLPGPGAPAELMQAAARDSAEDDTADDSVDVFAGAESITVSGLEIIPEDQRYDFLDSAAGVESAIDADASAGTQIDDVESGGFHARYGDDQDDLDDLASLLDDESLFAESADSAPTTDSTLVGETQSEEGVFADLDDLDDLDETLDSIDDLIRASEDEIDQALADDGEITDVIHEDLDSRMADDADGEIDDLDSLFDEIENVVRDEAETADPIEESVSTQNGPGESPSGMAGGARPNVYFLHGESEESRALAAALESQYEIQEFVDSAEFVEMLSAIGPDAVIIDDSHLDQIDRIGRIVAKLKVKMGQLPLMVLSARQDVTARLGLMRAGVDAFLPADRSVKVLVSRVSELVLSAPEDPYRILIVEDDRSQALFAESILRRAGLEARIERDPLQVVAGLNDFRPDLILMDLHMPDCDGMELTTIIRDQDDFLHTPIVFLSGEDDEDTHFDALLAGGDDFLTKPIRPRHLISAVRNRVGRARQAALRTASLVSPQPAAANAATAEVPDPVDTAELSPEPQREPPREPRQSADQFCRIINDALAATEAGQPDRPGSILSLRIDQSAQYSASDHAHFSRLLSDLVMNSLRQNDSWADDGEGGLLVVLGDRSEAAVRQQIADWTAKVSERAFDLPGSEPLPVSLSVTFAQLSRSFESGEALLAGLKHASQKAAADGQAEQVAVHLPAAVRQREALRTVGDTVTDALDRDEFQLVYQPVASLQEQGVEQYQCFLRLPGDEGQALSPPQLLAAAESLEMLDQIDRWVLEHAIQTLTNHVSEQDKPLRLFVNQSVAAVRDHGMAEWIGDLLADHQIPGTGLVLEFKLGEIARHLQATIAFGRKIASRRVRLCLGQFDGSETAFKVLDYLPVEYVKFSPKYVSNIAARGRPLTTVVERLHDSNHRVIAPAVEDTETAIAMWSAGVDFIQGHFVQQPEPELNYQFANVL